jgi:hypothetical protein
VDDSGGCDDEDTGGVNISFIDQFNQLTGLRGSPGALRLKALLLKQLRDHRPSELIAFRSRRQAIDAPGPAPGGAAANAGHPFCPQGVGIQMLGDSRS